MKTLTFIQINKELSLPIYIADHANGEQELIMRYVPLTNTYLIEYLENGKVIENQEIKGNADNKTIALATYNMYLITKKMVTL